MNYKYPLTYIIKNIKPNDILHLKNGRCFVTKTSCYGKDYKIKCSDEHGNVDVYGLKYWYDKQSIVSDSMRLFELTTENIPLDPKEKETSVDRILKVLNGDSSNEKSIKLSIFSGSNKQSGELFTYSKMFSLIRHCGYHNIHCGHLWHISHVKNVAHIVRDGCLKGRYYCNKIPYDNLIENDVTRSVMFTNKTDLIEKYVRLYLNPINKAFYRFKSNMDENMVLISFDYSLIMKSENPVLINIGLGHSMDMEDFNWKKYAINNRYTGFKLDNLKELSLNKIFERYDPNSDDLLKEVQMSEILVYKQLDIKYIDKIYFMNSNIMMKFLDEIKSTSCYNNLKDKCEVNIDIFKGSVNDTFYR